MKKIMLSLGVVAAVALSLVSCQKEMSQPNEPEVKGTPFEIIATSADTKTVNNGLATEWAGDESINLFHAAAGTTTYNNGGEFTTTEAGASAKFNGTLSTELSESNDWYAFYPYSSYITTPANISNGYSVVGSKSNETQTQEGVDSKAHLSGIACPMYAIATGIAKDETPALSFHHLTSAIKVHVTNNSGEELIVDNVAFTAEEKIIGTYYIDFSTDELKYTPSDSNGKEYTSNTATLSVTNASLADGAAADFYLAIKPFTATADSELKLSVNGYDKTLPLAQNIVFNAGVINNINFNYDKEAEPVVKETWTLIGGNVDAMPDGEYVILANDGSNLCYLPTTNITKNPAATQQSIFDGTTKTYEISGNDVTSLMRWNFKKNDDKTWTISTSSNSLSIGTSAQTVAVGKTASKFTIDANSGNTNSASFKVGDRFLGIFVAKTTTDKDWRAYTNLTDANYGSNGIGAQIHLYYCGEIKVYPSIVCADITGVSARGGENIEHSYTLTNPVEGTALEASCDGEVVTEVIADGGEILYTVSANTTSAVREGKITLTYGEVVKEIKVSQLAPVFKAAHTEVELNATAGAKTTVTITSDFDWIAEASADAGFTFSPETYIWAADGKQTVTITATSANETETVATLGTLTITNMETYETIEIVVKQKGVAVLKAIEWTNYQTTYTLGDEFVKNGKVTAIYSDGSTADVTAEATFSEPDMTTIGEKEVTVTYEGLTATGIINVQEKTVGETEITWSTSSDWNQDTGTMILQQNGYTIKMLKNNGSSNPTINDNDKSARLYAKGTLTISGPSFTSIELVLGKDAGKRYCTLKADTGTLGVQTSGDTSVHWTGSATSVTFTVPDKSDLGSDGNAKAAQLHIAKIIIK